MRLYEAFTRKGEGPLTDRDSTAHVWTSMYMGHSARIQNVRSYPTNLQQIRPEHDFLKDMRFPLARARDHSPTEMPSHMCGLPCPWVIVQGSRMCVPIPPTSSRSGQNTIS